MGNCQRAPEYPRTGRFGEDICIAGGIALGQETFLGSPRIGVYKPFPLSRNLAVPRFGFYRYSWYMGVDASLMVLFAGWASISANSGLRIGPVTVDNAWTWLAASGPDGQNFRAFSTNPKVGLMLGPIWLKVGPTIYLKGGEGLNDWLRLKGVPLNFEVRYVHRLGG